MPGSSTGAGWFTLKHSFTEGANFMNASGDVTLVVGNTYELGNNFSLETPLISVGSCAASDSCRWPDGSSHYEEVNAGNSAYLALNFLTPGVTYTSASGTTYLTSLPPVPEPETYAMMIAGLAVLGAVARRRKQQGV